MMRLGEYNRLFMGVFIDMFMYMLIAEAGQPNATVAVFDGQDRA